ncbi:dTDP-4-dehydrorhamnose reductase [Rhodobacteraceae bacterium THAF1]|uniref:complex I NDUFA9 subunit family protein n=1 Tax=Palleronia sp. THAF1 TaxID=2587842 RepID=UPI000F3EFA94|nr:complex I NDUFA9 subunit family protein [Palleronia sp. THAF1]QFU10069.1 dTDP-4-dehydrorhamnose reductase [Palleronia sp. THAF1]VDC17026.1 dTDP-4-dehydrorhamnose reductase [Rhodobacteraceae bacterium THAF1]
MKLVTIFGGTGFVGRYVARRMAKQGWRVRCACRRPNDAPFVRTYGSVGQVEPIFCNIRDDDSVRAAIAGSDAVVNCVGVLEETGKQTFQALQQKGAARIATMAKKAGVAQFVLVSAIGADENAPSEYARTKAAGEKAVLDAFPSAMIVRPSIIFGHEDEFFNRFAGMARMAPLLPLVGASTKFQPVYVDDVAAAIELGVLGKAEPGIYELGGPDVSDFREWMREMLATIRRRALILNTPMPIAKLMGWGFDLVKSATFGLIAGPLTLDQVRNLGQDNIVGEGVKTFADLGIQPIATEAVLPDYLWRFRPSGQYAESNDSAENLHKAPERMKGGSNRAGFS